MCGIAGIVGAPDDRWVDRDAIHRMCQAIVHRGPDDEGCVIKGGVGLGMRRLSVIDVAGGHQPVFSEDRKTWVVFNGEIYNFRELRKELEARGHQLQSHTDTEVIAHLYEDFGADCVHKLRGMFAFALFDERRRYLLLARDRLGKKPLHYALAGGRLFFASEIKAILAVAPELCATDAEALLQYFYFGYIPDPATAFTAIRKLSPGHLLEFENGNVHIRQYWDLPKYDTLSFQSENECIEQLEEQLDEAVRMRLISDVPLGALLSGGVDSSTIVALMARASSRPVKTFSIGFRHADFNEADNARRVAKKFATEHHELFLEPDVLDTVDFLSHHIEEPFGDSSTLPTYYVSRLAREHVTVVLSGDGGDEVFAGYDRYRIHARRGKLNKLPAGLGKFYRQNLHPRLPRGLRGRRFFYNVSLPTRERYVEMISFLAEFERDTPLLSRQFREATQNAEDPQEIMARHFERANARDDLSRIQYLDTKTYLAEDILTKVDRMSMATSLEVRSPFLDHVLVEWATGLAPQWKLRGDQQKYIVRKLAEQVGVPAEILHLPKRGFAVPLVHWMRHEMKDLILTTLTEPRTLQRGYLDSLGVKVLLSEHFSQRRDHSDTIWRLLMFELWHRNYLGGIGLLNPPDLTSAGGLRVGA
jgi:asparagine synthase (glutamine-hydrolysing)